MPSDKKSKGGHARVSSFSKFQLPQLSNLDQNDLMSSVQSVCAKKDKGPPPSTRGFSSIPRQPSGNSGKSEEGFSGGYHLVMAQVEERRRLQSLGLAVGKKLASSPASTMPPSPLEGPPTTAATTTTTPKTRKRSSWQPPVNGKLQKSRSKSRDAHKGEPPTPTEYMLAPQHTFSRIHNAPPTPPPEPRERMAREFVLPNAMASGSDISFSKPRPPFAAQANSSTSSFAGSNASRSSLTSLTPSLDKAVYTLPPLSLGGLADVFTNEDGRGGSSTSLAKYAPHTTASPVAISPIISPIGSASPTLSAGNKKKTASLVSAPSPTCSSPLKRDLGNRKPSPPSAWKGVAGEDPAEERGRSRFDRTCHRYFSDEHDRRQALRKLDNLPSAPTTPVTGNILEPTISKAAAATFSSGTSTPASTATSKSASKATSKASSITTLTPASSISSAAPSTSSHSPTSVGNVPKKYVSGADIEKLHPVTRPYVETGLPRASRIPSTKFDNDPLPVPSPPPPPNRFSLPVYAPTAEPAAQLPDAMASTESILPPPPIPPRAPARASRDSSLARQMTSDLRQVQTISDLEDNDDDDEADTFEEIPPLKPGRNQITNVPSIGDMMRELNNDNWSEVDVPIRRPTLPRVPNAIPAMHKRQSEIPPMGRLPVRPSGYDNISSWHISHIPDSPRPESTSKHSSDDVSSDNLPSPLPSPSIPALGDEVPDGASPYANERARVSRVLVRPPSTLSDHQSIEEKRRSTDSSKFKFLKFHHRSKTQPAESSTIDPSDVTDSLLPPHERADWKTEDGVPSPQSVKLALARRDTGLPSPALTDSSSFSLHPPSKASASSSSTSLTVPEDPSRSKIKVFTICCGCHAWHDLPAKYYTVLFTKVAPVDCIWCKHQMSSNCCEAWTATTNLVERHI